MKEIVPYKRKDRYAISYRVPGYSQVFFESFSTEIEAKVRAAELTLQKMRGTLRPPKERKRRHMPTLSEFLKEYVENYGKTHWGDSHGNSIYFLTYI